MANNPSNFLISANDEHGVNPPTLGKRTPQMPYINRQIYENEFNYAAKNVYLADCLRIGFNVFDVKPNRQDLSLSARVQAVNNAGPTVLLTFAYNAFGDGTMFSGANGVETFYSPQNVFAEESQNFAQSIYDSVLSATGQNGRGVKPLDVSMLSSVRTISALIEAGFMTNFSEAKLMLDPDFVNTVGRVSTKGTCNFLNVTYVPIEQENFVTLKRGSNGRLVKYLQFLLKIWGYNPGAVDGFFGGNTQSAVVAFQQANGLGADGIVGAKTWNVVNNLSPQNTVLKLGSRGQIVRYLQAKLYSKLYPLTIDGIFGKDTQRVVKEFQQANGLDADGIVGEKTWQKVLDNSTSRQMPTNASSQGFGFKF